MNKHTNVNITETIFKNEYGFEILSSTAGYNIFMLDVYKAFNDYLRKIEEPHESNAKVVFDLILEIMEEAKKQIQ